jgi:predicted nucleic acid-binding protein
MIAMFPEPPGLERQFRPFSADAIASPKRWADAWLLAFATCHGAQLVTFDRALRLRGTDCLVLR